MLKARHEPYSLNNLPEPVVDLDSLKNALASSSSTSNPRPYDADEEGKAGDKAELLKLREQFEGLVIRSQIKATDERVFSMQVHPDPTKTLVFVGDKYGMSKRTSAIDVRIPYAYRVFCSF